MESPESHPNSQQTNIIAATGDVTGDGQSSKAFLIDEPIDWHDLTPTGIVIPGSRIVCFKTPFNFTRTKIFKHDDAFTTANLLNDLAGKNITLGMVVDLGHNETYYKATDLEIAGKLTHRKIRVGGKIVPPECDYVLFRKFLDEFMSDPASDGKVVGVHCIHGINRTGWFVCRYLMEKHGWPADETLTAFKTARGHGIYRKILADDLLKRCPAGRQMLSEQTWSSDEDIFA